MLTLIRSLGRTKLVLALLDFGVLTAVSILIVGFNTKFSWVYFTRRIDQAVFFAVSSVIAIIIFREFHLYKHRVYSTSYDQIVTVAKAMVWLAIVQAIGIFLIKSPDILDYSRGLVGFYLIGGWVGVSLARVGILRGMLRKRKWTIEDEPRARVGLIIGAGDHAQGLAARFHGIPELGITLGGFLDDDPVKIGKRVLGKHIYGPISALREVIAETGAEELFIAINSIAYERLLEIMEECRSTGLPVTVASDHFRIVHDKIGTSEFRIIDSLTMRPRVFEPIRWYAKRAMDFLGSAILLTVLSPLFAAMMLAIKITSRGPVFYRAQVVGKEGKFFTWYKFRTMYVNRDEQVHRDHLRKIIQGNASTKKLENDVRITSVGRFLRKYSLDELPQLFNVMRGDMSLIGPRPCLPYEYEHYKDWHKRRFFVVPGMTGLWQILGRNKSDVTFNDSMILDLYYVQNHTIWLDMKILLRTIPTVLFGRGGA